MWWQIIPSAAIVGATIYAPQILVYLTNSLILGNPYMRCINKDFEGHMYLRDYRLTGNVYKQIGLDCFTPVVEPEYIEECIPVKRLKEPQPKPEDED